MEKNNTIQENVNVKFQHPDFDDSDNYSGSIIIDDEANVATDDDWLINGEPVEGFK